MVDRSGGSDYSLIGGKYINDHTPGHRSPFRMTEPSVQELYAGMDVMFETRRSLLQYLSPVRSQSLHIATVEALTTDQLF